MFRKLYQSLKPFLSSSKLGAPKKYTTLTREAMQHYSQSLSAQEVNALLEETNQSQSYTLKMITKLSDSSQSDANRLKNYPYEVDPEAVDSALAEAEATRNKFSIY